MLQLTAAQAEVFNPVDYDWEKITLVHMKDFPEIDGRPMVFAREAYTRENERLVIEWDRDYTILALARNGHWVQGNLTWGILQIVLRDRFPNLNVKVTNAPGYADFEGELLLDSDNWPSVVVGFLWEGKRDVAVVPRECVTPL